MSKKNDIQKRTLSSFRPGVDGLVFLLSLLGIIVVVHLWIQSGRGFDRGCLGFSAPGNVADCNAVVTSDAGKLFGISNIAWGFFFYLAIAIISYIILVGKRELTGTLKRVRAVAIGVGFLYSLYLVYVQSTQIGQYCVLCLISAAIVAILFGTQVYNYMTHYNKSTADPNKFGFLQRVPVLGAFGFFTLVLAGADYMYFNSLGEAEAHGNPVQLASADSTAECRFDPDKGRIDNYQSMVTATDPSKGNPDAEVLVVEFFDPNCPACKVMHPIMQSVVDEHGDDARFVYRPFILWEHSIVQVEALHHAHQEGKFFEMLDAQFERQVPGGGLTFTQLEEIADEIGVDKALMKQRIERQLYRSLAMRHRTSGVEAGISSVPTVMINGRFVERNSRSAECLGQLIEQSK